MLLEEELELPPLDGESDGEEDEDASKDDDDASLDDARDAENPYDDAAGDDKDFSEGVDGSDEASAVGDDAVGVTGDVDDEPAELQSESLIGDDDAPGVAGEDFGLIDATSVVRDAGEEGFDAPEPELRVEDLPRLDDGDDDDLSVEEATEDLSTHGDLRWDDRGFERAFVRAIGHVVRIRLRWFSAVASNRPSLRGDVEVTLEDGSVLRSVDGGTTFSAADHASEDDEPVLARGRARALMRDGVGVLRAIDDGPLTLVEATAGATAFALLDDGTLVCAMDGPERARLLLVGVDGVASLVAEEDGAIEALAADSHAKIVWCGGAFGLVAFKF